MVALREATAAGLPWLRELVIGDAVAPSLATDAATTLDELPDDDGMHRLEAEVYGFNDPALRAFAAAGFVREGVRRSAYDRHGAWQDGVRFGLLASDRPA